MSSITRESCTSSIRPWATPITTSPPSISPTERGALDVLHTVVEIIHLPAPGELAADRVAYDAPVVLHHEGLHRQAVHGRLLDGGHIAYSAKRHVQRAGYRRCREREHIYLTAHLLDMFLVGNSEALLLVHYQQPQALEFHALLQQRVRADNEIALAALEIGERLLSLRARAEAAEHLDIHRVAEEALQRRLVMLLGEDGGGREEGRLSAVEHTLHRRAQGDLGLAVAHVAAEQAVHGSGAFHVGLYLADAAELVVGLLKAEALLKLVLPDAVGREGVALLSRARGIELYQPLRKLLCGGLRAGLYPRPVRAAHLGKAHTRALARADIFGNEIELRCRDIERVRARVAYLYIILLRAVHRHTHNAGEAAYAVVLVHHEIALGEIGAGGYHFARGLFFAPRAPLKRPGDLGICEHGKSEHRVFQPRGERPRGDKAFALVRLVLRRAHPRADVHAAEHLREDAGAALVPGEDERAIAGVGIVLCVLSGLLGAAGIGRELLCRYADDAARLHRAAPGGEGVGHIQRPLAERPERRVKGERIVPRRCGKRAGAGERGDVVAQLLQICAGALAYAPRLVEYHERVVRYSHARWARRRD